ncbi:MAG TPA: PIG-L family deacetylase [Thermoanaerobaculia bacterium]|nr:PIG-L family deacetylase [Thermoanaerobaculia bacterium]
MFTEAEAVPYQAETLRGERLLVLAPHPDDEAIGCGGLVALHSREGRAVHVVVATDGAAAASPDEDLETYRVRRERESQNGLALLAGDDRTPPTIEFLRFPDRQLAGAGGELATRLGEALRSFRPDLVLVPSPIEIHPDHLALSRIFCEVIQNDPTLFAERAIAQVAFYEVGQPLRPTALIDITSVAEAKWAAIEAHRSQAELRAYVTYSRGLGAYRSMTLGPETTHAEAYVVVPLASIRTTPFSALQRLAGDARRQIEVEHETIPITVVVRTKDRPALLQEALDSIRATGYPAEIVIVNDGGTPVEALGDGVRIIEHKSSRGRSEAANAGVRSAVSRFVAFLDDDDLYYPDHLATLARAASTTSQHAAWYTDAVSAFLRLGASGTYETTSRQRIFGQAFDPAVLLLDNYIPLPTLLLEREQFLGLGGFDPELDLFEDWDFLIRLSRTGSLQHVPRVTCEIRHIEGGGSITMASPEGSPAFREAKLHVWRKHAALIDNNLIAGVLESRKRQALDVQNRLFEEQGRGAHFERDIARLQRDIARLQRDSERLEADKQTLIGELQATYDKIGSHLGRIAFLEGSIATLEAAAAEARRSDEQKAAEIARLLAQIAGLERTDAEHVAALRESSATNAATYAEIGRLNGILETIYRSQTWKIHTMLDRIRGRK